MKIECLKEKLVEAITVVDKIPNKNQSLPVLSCVLLTATKNNLTINATNLDVGIKLTIPVKTTETGSVAVPVNTLSAFLNSVSLDKKVNLELSGQNLVAKTETTSVLIKAQVTDDFPVIPTVSDDGGIKINPHTFVKGLKSVWYAASTSTIKPELSSVYIHQQGDNLVFVSTDSFRLAEKKIKNKNTKEFPQTIVPSKNINHIIKTLESLDEDVSVCFDKNQIAFETGSLYLVSRVVEGNFPDYTQILPKTHITELIALKNDLIEAFKVSNIFTDRFSQVNIKVSPKEKIFQITTKNGDVGECLRKIESSVSGENIDINFNQKYISDCLPSIDSDSLSFSFTGPNKPLVIKGVQDNNFLYLVMPMNK